MKFAGTLIVLLAFLPVAGQAQINTAPAPRPTPLEAFAKQSTSRVAWSSEAGRIDSKEGHAVITALVVEDRAQPPDRLRGVRIDLADQDGKDQVYLGEETLPAFKKASMRSVKVPRVDVRGTRAREFVPPPFSLGQLCSGTVMQSPMSIH
jgi:hypothetical protein